MKKKFSKILGVALAFVIVFALSVSFIPAVSASSNSNVWAKYSIPTDDDWQLAPSPGPLMDRGPFDIAIDGTIYTYAQVDNDCTLFKSTDDGYNWSKCGTSGHAAEDIVVDIACSPDDADVVYYATADNVYKSEDAGSKFTIVGTSPGDIDTMWWLVISSLDVAMLGDDHVVVVGVDSIAPSWGGGVFVLDEGVRITPSWEDQKVNGIAYGGTIASGGRHVYDVALSPMFNDDKQIVAVMTDETDTWVTTKLGSAGWNDTIGDAVLEPGNVTGASVAATDKCSIAFPSDYDSDVDSDVGNTILFVGVDATGGTGGDVYKMLGISGEDNSVALDLDADKDITDLDVSGSASSCNMLAGTTDTTTTSAVLRTEDGGDEWKSCKKEPTGDAGKAYVRFSGDYDESGNAWAAVGGTEGAVSLLVEDRVWNQVGMINTEISYIHDLAFSPTHPSSDTMFVASSDNSASAGDDSVWRQSSNWQRVFSSTLAKVNGRSDPHIDIVRVSAEYTEDDTVFLGNKGTTFKLLRSTNNGATFSEQTRALPSALYQMAVLDDSTIVIGVVGGTHKTTNNGNNWKSRADTDSSAVVSFARSFTYADDETLLAGDATGHVWRSTNAAGKWSQLKDSNMSGAVIPAFDAEYADNATMYCTDAAGGVFRYIKGESSEWARIDINGSGTDYSVEAGAGLVVAPDGTLYAVDGSAAGEGMQRALYPTDSIFPDLDIYFEEVNDSIEGALTSALRGLWRTSGSNILWSIFDDNKVYYIEDTLTSQVTLISPSDGETSARQDSVRFKWDSLPGAKKYDLSVKYADVEVHRVQTTKTAIDWVNIPEAYQGVTLRWRVRVLEEKPYRSKWSDYQEFITKLGGGEWNPFLTASMYPGNVAPAPGATNIPLSPGFQWNAADWATNYEFVLAENPDFTSPIVSFRSSDALDTTAYEYPDSLSYSTTYYWKVRAIKLAAGGKVSTQSTWGTGIFTTMTKPVEPAPPVVVEQAPPVPDIIIPAPVTPAYVWVIIGIGGILVIAVIVLIVRTRRVV